jgi:hypothetical protein
MHKSADLLFNGEKIVESCAGRAYARNVLGAGGDIGGIEVMRDMVFCENCRKDVEYVIKDLVLEGILGGERYEYIGKSAYCGECDGEIFVGEIEDNNLKALYAERNRS